jgi:PAS domain S-box-containing protein
MSQSSADPAPAGESLDFFGDLLAPHDQDGAAPDVSDGVVLLDTSWRVQDLNAQALAFLQCERDALQGRNFWDAVADELAEVHQADTGRAVAEYGQHAFTAHREFEGTWLEYSFSRHPDGFIVNLRDATEAHEIGQKLERSERYNCALFDANPNAMWIFNVASSAVVAVNDSAVEFYRIPRKSFLKMMMGDLFPDGEGASLLQAIEPIHARGPVRMALQICKQKKLDGQFVLVELACSRIHWEGSEAVLVSITDITDRHLADRTLRRQNSELELQVLQLQRELAFNRRDLSAFTYALSHDLQAPLHAANGFATMLADKHAGALEQSGRHYVERIQASTRQLAKLVDDLRVLVQVPQLQGDIEEVDLARISAPLISALRDRHPGRAVTVEMDPLQPVMADRRLLVVALGCLLDNAWKFTARKAEAWIKLSVIEGQGDGELVIQVSDNGPGFDDAYADKLFSAFQRLHSSADFSGSGLGLAIVKRVADRHAGHAWAETSAAGASFFMSFPKGIPPAD